MIKKELKKHTDDYIDTEHVKKIFFNIAKNLPKHTKKDYGYCICSGGIEEIKTNQFHASPHEWLYDIFIIEQKLISDDYPYFAKAVVAVECEWRGRWDIISDFHKLLCCKCDNKIMIFNADQDKDNDLFDYMKNNIKLWKEKSNTYLLARWVGQKFEYKII